VSGSLLRGRAKSCSGAITTLVENEVL